MAAQMQSAPDICTIQRQGIACLHFEQTVFAIQFAANLRAQHSDFTLRLETIAQENAARAA
ncbi:hypothetical protein D3C71_1798450 [compost metagenome]